MNHTEAIIYARPGPAAGLLVALCLLLLPGCINWADAPRMQRAEKLEAHRDILQAAFPQARLAGAVYQLQMEGGRGYRVVSEQFLFKTNAGELYHGTIDRAGKLSECKAAFIETLPQELAATLFEGEHAPLANATLVAKPWTFTDALGKRFQFEFTQGERSGLCTTGPAGTHRQVYYFTAGSP
jgi:hypothetical protein